MRLLIEQSQFVAITRLNWPLLTVVPFPAEDAASFVCSAADRERERLRNRNRKRFLLRVAKQLSKEGDVSALFTYSNKLILYS